MTAGRRNSQDGAVDNGPGSAQPIQPQHGDPMVGAVLDRLQQRQPRRPRRQFRQPVDPLVNEPGLDRIALGLREFREKSALFLNRRAVAAVARRSGSHVTTDPHFGLPFFNRCLSLIGKKRA